MKYHRMYLPVVIIGFAVLLAGCPDSPNNNARVQIVYEQLANFQQYSLSADASGTTSIDGIFVLYRIKRITNAGSEANTFVFDKHKIAAVAPDKTSNEEPSGDNVLLGAKLVTNLTVQPGQTVNNPGCIIKSVLTSNPQSLANTSALVDIVYNISQSQPVSMNRAAGDNTTALVTNALPSTLQNLCGS